MRDGNDRLLHEAGGMPARVDFDDEGLFKAIVDALPDAVFLVNPETNRFLFANETACRVTGYSLDELVGMETTRLTGLTLEQSREIYADTIAAGEEGTVQLARFITSKDGKRKGWWEAHLRAIKLNGRWTIIRASREVSSRVLAERALQRSKRMYAAFSATNEALMRARTPEEIYRGVCEAAVDAGGLTHAAILLPEPAGEVLRIAAVAGRGRRLLKDPAASTAADRPEGRGLTGTAYRRGEPCISNDYANDPRTAPWHEQAQEMQIKAAAAILILRDGAAMGVMLLCSTSRRTFDEEVVKLLRSMTDNVVFALQALERQKERERAEERVRYLATHDSLTGLPNRALFDELLDQAVAHAHRYGKGLALMFLDLDRFKQVNDTLGHTAGDILLKEVAGRLRAMLRESDVLARLSGDEFVVLLQDVGEPEPAAVVARKLLKLLEASVPPLTVMGQECRVSASIGISLYPDHGETRTDLMKNADTAMYRAKDKGGNTFEFYVPGLQRRSSGRLAL